VLESVSTGIIATGISDIYLNACVARWLTRTGKVGESTRVQSAVRATGLGGGSTRLAITGFTTPCPFPDQAADRVRRV
jgi:hypothetical protein